MKYIERYLQSGAEAALKQFGAVVVTGPRQAGKTTLLREIARRKLPSETDSIAFDTPSEMDAFRRDPDLFFANHPGSLFLDEIQNVPDIFPYLKREIDAGTPGRRFLISGSQSFVIMRHVTESLAGRAAILDLWPFCSMERPGRTSPSEAAERLSALENPDSLNAWRGMDFSASDRESVFPLMFAGGYPPLLLDGAGMVWLESYRRTYLDRDIRSLSAVHDLGKFDRFLVMLAGRTGSVVNKATLSGELGIDNKTVDHWLSLLEASYQLVKLPPWYANSTKRLVKRPKYHFGDMGLALHLLAIRQADALAASPQFGHLFESYIVMEIRKLHGHCMRHFNGFFWGSPRGPKCDLVLHVGGRLVPIEIKHTSRPKSDDLRGLRAFMEMYGEQSPLGIVISMNRRVEKLSDRVWNVPLGFLI